MNPTRRALAALGLLSISLTGCTAISQAATTASGKVTTNQSSMLGSTTSTEAVSTQDSTQPSAQPTPTPSPASTYNSSGSARSTLEKIAVKGSGPKTGYSRDQFGPAWLDTDKNGCDSRNDTLGRQLTNKQYKPGTHNCVVTSGDIRDPYTNKNIHFTKGSGTSLDIDHVVALGNVWVSGGAQWPIKKRAAIANDPLNLLAVDYSANRQKGDSNAASWLPSNKAYRCAYVARQVAVKAKYELSVTQAEKDAMVRVLNTCPKEKAPTGGTPTMAPNNIKDPGQESQAPQETAAPTPTSSPGSTSSDSADNTAPYASCAEAREAGAAPVHRGDPGYSSRIDRDGDGVACE